jgi:putative nucleotidyltransferase with HDIG domain
MSLYREGHPARERAIDTAYEHLRRVLEARSNLQFTFLGEEVVCGTEPLRELAQWEWTKRLANAGVQRLELDSDVSRDDFEEFLSEVFARLNLMVAGSAEARQMRSTRIRFGAVGLGDAAPRPAARDELEPPEFHYPLQDEAETLRWLHEEVQDAHQLHLAEADAIVRSLTLAMHSEREMLIPLLRLRHFDEYTTTHAMNVSVLAMALTEYLGLPPVDVRTFGVAGLLHDIGKIQVPRDILIKPGKLTLEERQVMNTHTVEGARIILGTQEHLDLAAVVAYEHHIMIDGGGYPTLRFRRDCHYASKIVHVCDVYDALRTHRPYRDAWESERVIAYITDKAGIEFDPRIAQAFVAMMQKWDDRIARITETGQVVGNEHDAAAQAS